jgi:sulfate transport system substrate-binding protein
MHAKRAGRLLPCVESAVHAQADSPGHTLPPMLIDRRLLGRKIRAAAVLGFFALLLVYAVWPWFSMARAERRRVVVFYGFSILGESVQDGVFPLFARQWKEQTGETVTLVSSFAGSGTVTNQLLLGVPAHMALLSLELDALRLARAGTIRNESWRDLPEHGVVNRTPFVILVRPGNPKRIHDFADLARPGIRIVHPDPLTSGGANWAIVAEYGAAARSAADPARAGRELLLGIWRNVAAQAASARAARTQFDNGFGDALVTYEQEAVYDRSRGKLRSEIVYPRRTILSEHTLVVLDRNIAGADRPATDAFRRFLWSDEAQAAFVRYGFRSVREERNTGNPAFGRIEEPFTIADLGGWERANAEIVERVWKGQVLKELGR